jgi:hypothetical protein
MLNSSVSGEGAGVSMSNRRVTRVVGLALGLIGIAACSASVSEQGPLSAIDGPQGGKVVYGPVNETSPQGAMAAVLRYVHTQFGEAPLVGKVFQSRDGQNFGAFFTVTGKRQKDKRFAGLAIVSLARGPRPPLRFSTMSQPGSHRRSPLFCAR